MSVFLSFVLWMLKCAFYASVFLIFGFSVKFYKYFSVDTMRSCSRKTKHYFRSTSLFSSIFLFYQKKAKFAFTKLFANKKITFWKHDKHKKSQQQQQSCKETRPSSKRTLLGNFRFQCFHSFCIFIYRFHPFSFRIFRFVWCASAFVAKKKRTSNIFEFLWLLLCILCV